MVWGWSSMCTYAIHYALALWSIICVPKWWKGNVTAKSTASVPTKFCSVEKDRVLIKGCAVCTGVKVWFLLLLHPRKGCKCYVLLVLRIPSCFYIMGPVGRIEHDIMLRRVCHVAVTVEHQAFTMFGWVCQNAALGAKSAVYDCLVVLLYNCRLSSCWWICCWSSSLQYWSTPATPTLTTYSWVIGLCLLINDWMISALCCFNTVG